MALTIGKTSSLAGGGNLPLIIPVVTSGKGGGWGGQGASLGNWRRAHCPAIGDAGASLFPHTAGNSNQILGQVDK